MHEIAVWRNELTLPPFHPSRVLSEKCFRRSFDLGSYELISAKPLHINQGSAENLKRSVRDVSSSGVFAWYSQVSKGSDRASLMLYTVDASDASDASGWYAGFTKKDEWCLAKVKGISRGTLTKLLHL